MRAAAPALLFASFCLAFLMGCRSAGVAEAPQAQALRFSPEQYRVVHAAAAEVLRDHGFTIARNDYRFGVITTEPKESPTLAEFWIDDASTAGQRRSDTLNAQQRTVTIKIDRAEAAVDGAQGSYRLTVQVFIERLQRPDRLLTHSVTGELTTAYAQTPTHLRERGLDGPYAQTLTPDPWLEDRLLRAIRAAAQPQALP